MKLKYEFLSVLWCILRRFRTGFRTRQRNRKAENSMLFRNRYSEISVQSKHRLKNPGENSHLPSSLSVTTTNVHFVSLTTIPFNPPLLAQRLRTTSISAPWKSALTNLLPCDNGVTAVFTFKSSTSCIYST